MINSTSKVAYAYKKGQVVSRAEVSPYASHGLPWFEEVRERFESQPTANVRITIDTEIEITTKQVLGAA